jgi:hypothetical protein
MPLSKFIKSIVFSDFVLIATILFPNIFVTTISNLTDFGN